MARIHAPRLYLAEALDRLLLGIGLVLLVLFILAGRTLWVDLSPSALPSWTLPFGMSTITTCMLGGLVTGGCVLARRLRPDAHV